MDWILVGLLICCIWNTIQSHIICKLRDELEAGKKRWSYYEARFVECNECTPEDKEKCLMFSEMLCDGDRCKKLVDLEELINKDDLK